MDPFSAMLGNAALNFLGGERANEENKDISQANRDFQYQMSNTAHQREVADLYAAGINPIMTARLGGASTPPGASAVMTNAIGQAANSGMAAGKTAADINNAQAQKDLIIAQTGNTTAATAKSIADTRVANSVEKINAITAEILANKSLMSDVAAKGTGILDKGADAILQGAAWAGETAAKIGESFSDFKNRIMKGYNEMKAESGRNRQRNPPTIVIEK